MSRDFNPGTLSEPGFRAGLGDGVWAGTTSVY